MTTVNKQPSLNLRMRKAISFFTTIQLVSLPLRPIPAEFSSSPRDTSVLFPKLRTSVKSKHQMATLNLGPARKPSTQLQGRHSELIPEAKVEPMSHDRSDKF